MLNADIEIDERNKTLIEEDGKLFYVLENGEKIQLGWDVLLGGLQSTEVFRAENIVSMRKNKFFSDVGIDFDAIMDSYLSGAANQILTDMVIEEMIRLNVNIISLVMEDGQFDRLVKIGIK